MKTKKYMHLDKLIEEYVHNSEKVNVNNKLLLDAPKGFFSRKLKSQVEEAKQQHAEYQNILLELEQHFIGELEHFAHDNLALLAIKGANQDAASRARIVFISSLERFERSLSTIEESFKFNRTVSLARVSILVAILSIVLNYYPKVGAAVRTIWTHLVSSFWQSENLIL